MFSGQHFAILEMFILKRPKKNVFFRCASISSSEDQDSLPDWKLTVPQIPQIPQISSLKMECHSKWNVTQNEMSLSMECHSKWNITQNGISLKMKCHFN